MLHLQLPNLIHLYSRLLSSITHSGQIPNWALSS
jgi:hypothetical protein